MNPGDRVAAASKQLSQATGRLNLMLAQRRVSRATCREAAAWARQAAEVLESVAGVDPPATRGVPFGGDSATGGYHGHHTQASGKAGHKPHRR